jgi:hypothetical protein
VKKGQRASAASAGTSNSMTACGCTRMEVRPAVVSALASLFLAEMSRSGETRPSSPRTEA